MDDDKILLKIHRQYSRDDGLRVITQELKEAQVEIGKLNSYITELQDENKKQRQELCTLKTKANLVKRYFKVKFAKYNGLVIKRKKEISYG